MAPMATQLRPLSSEELSRLTEDEQAEYLEHLEALYYAKGREDLLAYSQMIEVPGAPIEEPEPDVYYPQTLKPAAHHKLLVQAIQNLADGTWHDVDGVIALAPPGSAKSTWLSVIGSSWLLGRKPGTNVIGASYGQDLANRFGRRVRTVAKSPIFEKIMGATVSGDNSAVDNWSLTSGSDYRAAGMGAAVTGFRADWLLLDDPIKGREEADSQVIRDKVWSGLHDDLFTRLKPGGRIVVCLTHWHQDDPAGRILGSEWKGQSGLWRGTDGRLWHVINLPMLAEHHDDPLGRKPGEMLWPEWYREAEVKRLEAQAFKGGSAARTWSSLYQQRPAPAEGSILLRSYWKPWTKKNAAGEPEPPECDFILLSYDLAIEADEDNDYSAMTAWGIFPHTSRKSSGEEYHHHHAILLGAWRDKIPAVDLPEIISEHRRILNPDLILIERRASGHVVLQELKRRRFPVKAWLPKGKPGTLGKVPRAHGVAMILEQGAVHYVVGPKTEAVISECAALPNGAHDDWADTVTMSLQWFRDRFMFKTADDEPDAQEIEDIMRRKMDARRESQRRLYGHSAPPQMRTGQNERRLYGGGKVKVERDEPAVGRMTEETRRRLYGA